MRQIILHGPTQRDYACNQIRQAPDGYVVTIKKPTRNLQQNAKMWAMLSDLSKQKPDGWDHKPEVWKALMMSACGHELEIIEGLNGEPFPLGYKTSKMTKQQMNDLITFIYQWGDERGIVWSEPRYDDI